MNSRPSGPRLRPSQLQPRRSPLRPPRRQHPLPPRRPRQLSRSCNLSTGRLIGRKGWARGFMDASRFVRSSHHNKHTLNTPITTPYHHQSTSTSIVGMCSLPICLSSLLSLSLREGGFEVLLSISSCLLSSCQPWEKEVIDRALFLLFFCLRLGGMDDGSCGLSCFFCLRHIA